MFNLLSFGVTNSEEGFQTSLLHPLRDYSFIRTAKRLSLSLSFLIILLSFLSCGKEEQETADYATDRNGDISIGDYDIYEKQLVYKRAPALSWKSVVKPILSTHWDQRYAFTRFSPQITDDRRIGCWSTAIAQILYYHRVRPTGLTGYVGTTDNDDAEEYQISEDFDSYAFDFSKFINRVTEETSEAVAEQVVKYSYFVSTIIRKAFGRGYYYYSPSEQVASLELHYPVDAQYYDYKLSTTRREAINLIKSELGIYKRPVMVYIGNHTVVVDGYRSSPVKFEVHILWGHGIYELNKDKWYDFDDSELGDGEHRGIMTISKSKSKKIPVKSK